MLHNVALAEDEQFEERWCRQEKGIFFFFLKQLALAGISKMCMIMELRYLHLLHTFLHLSLSQHYPPHTLSSLLLSFYLSMDPSSSSALCHIGSGLSQKQLVSQTPLPFSSVT